MKSILICICIILNSSLILAQDSKGTYVKDTKTGVSIWFKNGFQEDSAIWSGTSKNKLANGYGRMLGFTKGIQTSSYTGTMKNGKPNGSGIFAFGNNTLKLQGNFNDGELLNLSSKYLHHLHKIEVFNSDSSNIYVGDNEEQQLYYHALIPNKHSIGAIILLPGTWETTEHLISSNQKFCELAFDKNMAVIVPSINQRLTMTNTIIDVLNATIDDAIKRYAIPKNKFVIGGWSMGGLFSLRYTELANKNSNQTAIIPIAAFSCDGPCDLENMYYNFQRKHKKFPNAQEPIYGLSELENYCGGEPSVAIEQYIQFSSYSHNQENGGNAKYLKNTPVRIYSDVDPNWWLVNRGVDMYDLNALDQTAMILYLNEIGNKKAEFINAFGKGYRLEGNRHPHSWSIIDPVKLIQWILTYIH